MVEKRERRKRGQIYFLARHGGLESVPCQKNKSVPFFLLVAVLCSTAGCGAAVCKDAWLGPDKTKHFAAGFVLGAATSTIAGHQGWSPAGSAALGLGVAAAGGAAKETADLKVAKTCWSWKDLAWDLLGGVVGTAAGTVASH